jgi:hypothetical protein
MKNLCKDNIFSSFVYSMELNVDNESLIKDIYHMKNNVESAQKSNMGGWQSPGITNEIETESFTNLKNKIKEAVNLIIDLEKLPNKNYSFYYWANVNKTNNYNIMHRHQGSLMLAAVYYPFVPNGDSTLDFHRTDGASEYYPSCFTINCRTNMLCIFTPHLFHSVSANTAEQDRISIAFNIVG